MSYERQRYIILDVDFVGHTDYGRALDWIAPTLKDTPGLVMTEDTNEDDEGRSYCHNCQKRIVENADGQWESLFTKGPQCADEGEHEPVVMHRKWAGTIPEPVYQKLASDWCLEPARSEPNLGMLTEHGHLESYAFGFDGMDWNVGGETPIAYTSLYVSVYPDEGAPA